MKKISFFRVLLLLIVVSICAKANVTPSCCCPPPPSDCSCDGAIVRTAPYSFDSLEHRNFYIWQIANLPTIPAGEHITEAGLLFKGINNWKEPEDDILYIHLLSKTQIGGAVEDLDMWPSFNPGTSSKVYTGHRRFS